jgi:hypothetical protein
MSAAGLAIMSEWDAAGLANDMVRDLHRMFCAGMSQQQMATVALRVCLVCVFPEVCSRDGRNVALVFLPAVPAEADVADVDITDVILPIWSCLRAQNLPGMPATASYRAVWHVMLRGDDAFNPAHWNVTVLNRPPREDGQPLRLSGQTFNTVRDVALDVFDAQDWRWLMHAHDDALPVLLRAKSLTAACTGLFDTRAQDQ